MPAVASTETWTAEFKTVSDRNGKTPIEILVSSDLWKTKNGEIAVEIDNVDVTSLIRIGADVVTYTPAEPFEAGLHDVRLYEVTESGDYIEQGYWQFEIAGTAGIASDEGASDQQDEGSQAVIEASADNSIEISQRLFDKNISSTPDDTTFSGAGSGSLNIAKGNWTFSSSGNYFIESEEDLTVDGNKIDLGEYTMKLQYSGSDFNTAATFGHHDIGMESLAMSSFNRRGISVSAGTSGERLKITGFSLSSDSLAGANNFSGQKEETGYVSGGALVGRPIWQGDSKIELTGLYFTSEGGEADFGAGGGLVTDGAPRGQGGAFIADSYWYQDRLRLRGEYAFSNMDLDGAGALDKDFADAEAFDISYILLQDDGTSETPLSLTVGGKWERVDTFFYSLANQGLNVDRNSYSSFANMYWGALSLNAVAGYETNNADDLADVATDRVITANIDGNYSFTIDREHPDDMAWLGTPFIGFGVSYVDADRKDTPVGYLGDDTDNATLTYYANVGSSYERWNWQLSYNKSTFSDETDISSDTADETIDLSAYWTVSDALNLSAGTQFNRYIQKDDGERSYNVTGNMGVQAILVPDTLTTNWNYNMNLSSGSGDIPDKHILSGEMEWTFLPAEVNKPGVALAFRGAMEKEYGNSDSSIDDTSYEGFIVLRLKAPLAY
ncbi:MAG: hypothetical protein ABJN40_20030 [Sneathiella sp.]